MTLNGRPEYWMGVFGREASLQFFEDGERPIFYNYGRIIDEALFLLKRHVVMPARQCPLSCPRIMMILKSMCDVFLVMEVNCVTQFVFMAFNAQYNNWLLLLLLSAKLSFSCNSKALCSGMMDLGGRFTICIGVSSSYARREGL